MSQVARQDRASPDLVLPPMSEIGPSRHFAAAQQFGRFWSEADIQRTAPTKPNYEYAPWQSLMRRHAGS